MALQVLVVAPGWTGPAALQSEDIAFTVVTSLDDALLQAEDPHDVLVLMNLTADEQSEVAFVFHDLRAWRSTPILFMAPPGVPGLVIPAAFRPEVDGFSRGSLDTPAVQSRLREFVRPGAADGGALRIGDYDLDVPSGSLRWPTGEVRLTAREAHILALLFERPGETVGIEVLLERVWGRSDDAGDVQIVRRHVSNLRRKLAQATGSPRLQTDRGVGYRVAAQFSARAH